VLVAQALVDRGLAWAGRTAVHLAWLTGLCAARSLHVEPLVRHWFRGEPTDTGLWLRLLGLRQHLGPLVNMDQRAQLLLFCNGMASRQVVPEDLRLIAQGLRGALGHPELIEDLPALAPTLSRLAVLARVLAPPRHSPTSQPRLLAAQVALLAEVLDEVLRESLPLTLLVPTFLDANRRSLLDAPAEDPAGPRPT
jgi:hypothetical protein